MNDRASTATKRYQCRHIHIDGRRCASPCLRAEDFCYYHHTTRKPIANPRARRRRSHTFHLPLPEDRSAVQASIGQVLQRIAANEIDPKRAGLLLYGLQIASLNLAKDARDSPRRNTRSARPTELDTHSPFVEDIIHHPIHGPLAPSAELLTPEYHPTTARLLLDQLELNDRIAILEQQLEEERQKTPTPPQSKPHPTKPPHQNYPNPPHHTGHRRSCLRRGPPHSASTEPISILLRIPQRLCQNKHSRSVAMFCTTCGKSIDPTARFCSACGAAVSGAANAYAPPPPPIPLFRPRHPRAIGGVCAAFAVHYGWDISIVRILTVFATLACGFPLLVYIAAWIIIPDEVPYAVTYPPPANESSSNLA